MLPNPQPDARSATLVFKWFDDYNAGPPPLYPANFVLSQLGTSSPCPHTVSPTTLDVPGTHSTGSIAITGAAG